MAAALWPLVRDHLWKDCFNCYDCYWYNKMGAVARWELRDMPARTAPLLAGSALARCPAPWQTHAPMPTSHILQLQHRHTM